MNQSAKLKRLVAAHPFLAGLNPQVSRLFCQYASLQTFDKGQEVFQQGGKADHFYLIETGQVLLEMLLPGRGTVAIQSVGPGEALGWSWLFSPFEWHFSATATAPTQTIAFSAECLRQKARENQQFCYELMVRLAQVLARRLEDVTMRLFYTCQGQR